jgi:hypothetical protein
LFKKYTVIPRSVFFHNRVVEVEERTCPKQPAVVFRLISRELTHSQVHADERLFKKLVARAKSPIAY